MEAHHFCGHLNEEVIQCVIFDGNDEDADKGVAEAKLVRRGLDCANENLTDPGDRRRSSSEDQHRLARHLDRCGDDIDRSPGDAAAERRQQYGGDRDSRDESCVAHRRTMPVLCPERNSWNPQASSPSIVSRSSSAAAMKPRLR